MAQHKNTHTNKTKILITFEKKSWKNVGGNDKCDFSWHTVRSRGRNSPVSSVWDCYPAGPDAASQVQPCSEPSGRADSTLELTWVLTPFPTTLSEESIN